MKLSKVDNIYVCHCKALIDRVQFMKDQLEKYSLDTTWVTNFDRDELDTSFLENFLPLYDVEFSYTGPPRKLTIPEISIMMKQYSSWSDIVNQNFGSGLILEDDIVLSEDFLNVFNQQIKELEDDFDFVWVGSCCNLNLPFNGKHLIRNNQSRCAHAYMVSQKAAKILIQNLKNNNFPVDNYLSIVIQQFNLKSYWMEPDLIKQSTEFETSIQNKT